MKSTVVTVTPFLPLIQGKMNIICNWIGLSGVKWGKMGQPKWGKMGRGVYNGSFIRHKYDRLTQHTSQKTNYLQKQTSYQRERQ